MASLTVRQLDDKLKTLLRLRAARHGRSMEAEVRVILQERLTTHGGERGLGSRIRARFQGLEGDLELPDRSRELPIEPAVKSSLLRAPFRVSSNRLCQGNAAWPAVGAGPCRLVPGRSWTCEPVRST